MIAEAFKSARASFVKVGKLKDGHLKHLLRVATRLPILFLFVILQLYVEVIHSR